MDDYLHMKESSNRDNAELISHKDAEIRRLVEELSVQKRGYDHLKTRFLKYLKNHSTTVQEEDNSLVYSRTFVNVEETTIVLSCIQNL